MRLAVDGLACRRGDRLVVAGVGFELQAGEALLVTGRNGAGKSTLLAALAGLLRPAAGTVSVSELGERSRRTCLHHLGHRDGLKASLTAAENLRFAAAVLGPTGLGVADALRRVGLSGAADLPASFLSAGQRRRVALARLLVSARPLWLLDEPATALDRDGTATLLGLLDGHLSAGGLVVAATHARLPLANSRELELAPAAATSPTVDA